MRKYILSLILLFSAFLVASGQSATQGNLNVNAGNDTLFGCPSPANITLTATGSWVNNSLTSLFPGSTSSYRVDSTRYIAPSIATATLLTPDADNKFYTASNIGFNFCFYGTVYTTVNVCSNGFIKFGATGSTGEAILNVTGRYLGASTETGYTPLSIFGHLLDLNPLTGGDIYTETKGVAPFRRFVVTYNNVVFAGACSAIKNTFQIILYEGSNAIEIHTTEKGGCASSNGNRSTSGIIGIPSSSTPTGVAVPNRNDTTYSVANVIATHDAWRFTPNGLPQPTITWDWFGGSTYLWYRSFYYNS